VSWGDSAAVIWKLICTTRRILRTGRNKIFKLNSCHHICKLSCNLLSTLQIKVPRNMKEQVLLGLLIRKRNCRAVHYKLFW